ncbi:MAG: hypothetical protein H0U59_03920 [Gemmatimonadaceae bacterium]|nr:hypothetical protein [Gemmatimonadaceae bacterium]
MATKCSWSSWTAKGESKHFFYVVSRFVLGRLIVSVVFRVGAGAAEDPSMMDAVKRAVHSRLVVAKDPAALAAAQARLRADNKGQVRFASYCFAAVLMHSCRGAALRRRET